MKTYLRFEGVAKKYSEDNSAIYAVSFALTQGEFAALAGPSGSGKTTLLNMAAGLDRPTAGKVELLGQDLSLLNADQLCRLRREKLGFVFQAYNLFPVLTALENVEYTLSLSHVHPRLRRERARAALEEVGLSQVAKRFPKELSGGQQQRVAVARAIVTRPALVFADEPTANLDSKTALQLIELFQSLNQKLGTTFLFSSHDAKVLGAAERLIEVADGRIQSDTLKARHAATLTTKGSEVSATASAADTSDTLDSVGSSGVSTKIAA